MTTIIHRSVLTAALTVALAAPAAAQWSQAYEQFYLPAEHNWVFRDNYAAADRLFNAFDYGHSILYEELYRRPNAPVERLEVDEYEFLTQRLLKRPPRLPLVESAIQVEYSKLAPEAQNMFHWAHVLHRQIYDVLADARLTQAEKDAAVEEVLAYYKTRPDLAFSSRPKSMDIMDGHHYSLAFRERYPKFNGLIWAYHWLQIGLYEPFLAHDDDAARTAGVNATVGRFWQMLENAPETMPYLMPMTSGVAPRFAARYPEAGIIFDNLHMMHDVISDILASDHIPRDRKREEILRAAEMFRDDTSYVISVEEWMAMGEMMGVHNMGGPAVGFMAELPTPTVPRGMSMAGMDHSGMEHGAEGGHEGHDAPAAEGREAHEGHGGMEAGMMIHGEMPAEHLRLMHEMHMRMMQDPVIMERVHADPDLRRMMERMHASMHGGDEAHDAHGEHDAGEGRAAHGGHGAHGAHGMHGAAADSAEVVAAVDRFHAALAAGDSATVLEMLTPDARILESGGIETVEEYRGHHLPADIEFAASVPRERGPIEVRVEGDVAWAWSTSTARGEFRGRAVNSATAELMVLTRTADGWRIAAIHWSSRTLRS